MSAEQNDNPFGLVYHGAITSNVVGQVQIHPVTYRLNNIEIAANVYTPPKYTSDGKFPAIVVAHPNGGVKEQVAGLYAQRLAEQGYITIAADAAYQGASGGTPRNVDKPAHRIEDIHGMADYTMSSLLDLMRFDAATNMELIDQPLLMIAGSKADTLYMTDEAFEKATGTADKKLLLLESATHIETYWRAKYVEEAIQALTQVYDKTLN
jgi:fermentation-respiration switch protein FrsA (DUF1100 family)